jgi:polar amino acid transport system substrate-binding protein
VLLGFVPTPDAAFASPLAYSGAAVRTVTEGSPRPQPKRQIDHAAMPPDIQQILHRGKLTVAVLGQDNPPFFMATDHNHLEGLDIQIAQALADQLGVTLDINRSAQTFDDVVNTVYQLEADLAISKVSRTLKRAQRVRFSQPYLQMRQGLLVNRLQLAQQVQGRSMEETIRSLKGKVGVLRNSSYVGFLKQKFPQATIVEFPTWPDIVNAVIRGEILAAYRDELEVKKVVRTKPDAALHLQTIALTDTKDSLAVVLPWSSTHLLAFIDQYLETLVTQYTVDGLLDEYAEYWSTQRAEKP